jgi:hypothetical protein
MVEPALDARFAIEPLRRRVVAHVLAHELDGDVAIDPHVAREPHFAHPAATELLAERVAIAIGRRRCGARVSSDCDQRCRLVFRHARGRIPRQAAWNERFV